MDNNSIYRIIAFDNIKSNTFCTEMLKTLKQKVTITRVCIILY